MAETKIKHSDLIEDKIFTPTIESGKEMLGVLVQLKSGFVDLLKTSKDFKAQGTPTNVKGLEEYEKKLNDIANADKALIAIEKEKVKLEQELLKLQTLETKATQERLKTESLYNKEIEKTAKAEAKKLKEFEKANSVYEQTKKSYNDLSKAQIELSLRGRENGKVFKAIKQEADLLRASLDKSEQGVGRFQRNVGNYKSGFNGLSNSINQLTREMPAFANSVQTGFMAISNNLPIFFDEISRANEEIKLLRKQGEQTPSLFSRLTSSLLNWGTGLSIGVTLLTVFGKQIVQFIGDLFKADEALKLSKESFTAYYDALTKKYEDYRSALIERNILEGKMSQEQANLLNKDYELAKKMSANDKIIRDELIVQATNWGVKLEEIYDRKTKKIIKLSEGEIMTNQLMRSKDVFDEIKLNKERNKILQELAVRQYKLNKTDLETNEVEKQNIRTKSFNDLLQKTDKNNKLEYKKVKEIIDLSKELRDAETANITNNYDRQRAELTNKFNDDFEKYKSNNALIVELTIKLDRDLKAIDEAQKADELKNEENHLNELYKLRKAQGEYEEKLKKEQTEKDKKRRQQEVEDNFRTAEAINRAIADGLTQRSLRRQEAISNEQQENETAIQRQQELAAKGLDNQLAFEEKKKAELALKLKQEREKQRQVEEAQQLASAYLEFLKERSKENPNTAPARALSDVLIAKAIGKTISGLYEGSESVSEEHAVGVLPQSKDNLLVPLHKGERVVGYEDSQRIKGLTNKELVHAGELYKTGFFTPEIQDVSKSQQVNDAIASMLSKKITELNNTLKNKREYSVNWDAHGNRVEQVVEAGMTKVIKKVSTGKARI